MVTKIKNLRQATATSRNFEQNPDTTTGSTFGVHAGDVVKEGAIVEIGATTFGPLAAGTYTIYADINEVTPVLKSELGDPTSGRYVPLYLVTSTGSSLTWTDLRSWTSASVGDDTGTGGGTVGNTIFDTAVSNLSPVIDLKFDQAAPTETITNDGSGSTTYDAVWQSADQVYIMNQVQGGDANGSYAFAQIDSTNSGAEIKDMVSPGIESDTAGAIMFVFKNGDTASSYFDIAEPNGDYLRGTYVNSNNNEVFRVQVNGVTGYSFTLDAPALNPSDNEWHMVVISQDGTDFKIYIDGVENQCNEAGSYSGSENDFWLANMEAVEDIAINGYWYYAANTAFSGFQGYVERFTYWSSALTDAQIGDLYDAWTGNGFDTDYDTLMTGYAPFVDYKCDATATINDDAGNFPTLSPNGATGSLVTAGGKGNTQTQALDFNTATADYYRYQDFALTPWSGKTSGSFIATFKSQPTSSSLQTIFKVGNFGSTGAGGLSNPGFRVNLGSSGTIEAQCYTSSTTVGWTRATSGGHDYEDEGWHMVVISHNGTEPTMYIDGRTFDMTTGGSNADYWLGDLATYMSTSTDNAVSIGGQSYSAGGVNDAYLWGGDGAIERVSFTDTVLTAAQARELWQAWRGTKT